MITKLSNKNVVIVSAYVYLHLYYPLSRKENTAVQRVINDLTFKYKIL